MNSTDNIKNAFHVVNKTYENIHKLMDYTKTIAPDRSHYVSVVDKFLRYKSDNDFSGWFIKDFILLFQKSEHHEFENEWRDGPLYVMEIELYDEELESNEHFTPCLHLSKFTYEEGSLQNWGKGCSPANHWVFYYPLRKKELMTIQSEGDITHVTPIDQDSSDRYYWGVREIVSKRIPLTDVTAENVVEKIFGTFDTL